MLGGGLTLLGTLLIGNASGNSTGMEEADEQEVSKELEVLRDFP